MITNSRGTAYAIFVCLLFASYWGNAVRADEHPAGDFSTDPRFGACVHFSQGVDCEKFMPLIEACGIGWVRDDLGWEAIEHQKGVYSIPEYTRKWIKAAHAHHLRLLIILNGGNALYADKYDPQAYAGWAAWTVKQLKGEIDAVEILNEPNNFGFMQVYGGKHEGEGDSPWVAKYVTLMNTAAEAIKLADPEIPIIGFGAGATVTYKQLAIGASPAVVGLVDHPYSNHSVPELVPGSAANQAKVFGFSTIDERGTFRSLIDGFHRQSAEHHGPKQIWLTEWGFSTYQPLADGQFSGFTESAQAKYILRRFVEGLGVGVDVSFLYEFNDGHNGHDAEDCWGLVHENGEAKESFKAVSNMTAALHDFHAVRGDEVGPVNVFPAASWPQQAPIAIYRFMDLQGRPAVAIWGTDKAGGDLQPRVADVEFMWGAGIEELQAVDLMTGKTEPVVFRRSGGRLIKDAMIIHDYPVLICAKGKAIVPTTAPATMAQFDLKIFDKPTAWIFFNGQEFPGAAGSFALGNDGEIPVGKLNYAFDKGGAYVSAETPIALAKEFGELRIDAKASRGLRISIRLIDATKQCHQFARACSGTGAWETIRIPLDQQASEHWGGVNDGKIHFPVELVALCVNKPPQGDVSGTVEFAHAVAVPK